MGQFVASIQSAAQASNASVDTAINSLSEVNEKIKDGATNQENTEDLDSYMNEIDE